jgi:uncharacterized protein (TIGR00251 family)
MAQKESKPSDHALPQWIKSISGGCSLTIKLQPRSSKNRINYTENPNEPFLKINVTSPPVDNEANQMLVKYLSEVLNVPKSSVQITHGNTARLKTVAIYGKTPLEVLNQLKSASGL